MATTALLAQLHAWRDVLQELGRRGIQLDETDIDTSRLVLRVDAGPLAEHTCDATLRTACEALSALTMLAQADVVAWRNEIAALWTHVDVRSVEASLYKRPRDIVMALRFEVDSVASMEPLAKRMILDDGFSPEFRALLRLLQTASATTSCDCGAKRLKPALVPVRLDLVASRTEPQEHSRRRGLFHATKALLVVDPVLHRIADMARVQCMNAEHHHRPELLLQIDTVAFGTDELAPKPDGIAFLGRLVERGIRVYNLPAIAPAWAPHDLVVGLRSLLGVTGTANQYVQYGVHSVTISEPRFYADKRPVLSAIQQSQSLRRVVLEQLIDIPSEEYGPSFWRWVGFALFSPRARHRIRTVELNLPHLRMSDITAMQALATTDNPHSLLKTEYTADVKRPTWVSATEFFHVGSHPDDGDDPEPIRYSVDTPIEVSVVDQEEFDGQQWLRVQIPGGDRAWIQRDQVTVLVGWGKPPLSPVPRAMGTFETVIFRGLTKKSLRTNMAMLRFFGHSVKQLELHGDVESDPIRGDENDGWLLQLLIDCPRLEGLTLALSDVRRVKPLLECVESRQCKIRRLKIDSLCDTDDLWEIILALGDSEHPLARQLEDMAIALNFADAVETLRSIQAHVISNRRMYHSSRTLLEPSTRRSVINSVFSSPSPHVQESTHVYHLHADCKLAFLSAVRSKRCNSRPDALAPLTAEAITTIFELAGHVCKWRISVV